jgi:cellobiose phosphorylase
MKTSQPSAARPVYDCDTQPYWCSDQEYDDRDQTFGQFIDGGRAYLIERPDTPRPWLNYLANQHFGSVVSNRGLGFTWYRTTLLRITKYDHPIDYLPRDFQDGRTITFSDQRTGITHSVLPDGDRLACLHRPGSTTFRVMAGPIELEITLFVPLNEPTEIWRIVVNNPGPNMVRGTLTMQQIWSIAQFGLHTAEEGIPYLSTPGEHMRTRIVRHGIETEVTNPFLPVPYWAAFLSPECDHAQCQPIKETRPDGSVFTFHACSLKRDITLPAKSATTIHVLSIATDQPSLYRETRDRLLAVRTLEHRYQELQAQWTHWLATPSCQIPDEHLQHFLNVWFKNQLHLTFYFVRSGHHGYRDSLQDAWGYTLLDADKARQRLLNILAHQHADGTAPRNFSAFVNGTHDQRQFMDSPVWIARTLLDLVKETGDIAFVQTPVPFLDGQTATVEEHAWRAIEALYKNRNPQGLCHTGDGDWNDALEGISRDGDAVSAWLTIALFDAMQQMIEIYEHIGQQDRLDTLRERAAELQHIVNDVAWDGQWYVYGFTGTGRPIGSHKNREGRIHLNAQAWAVFSGLADRSRAETAMDAVEEHLATPLGPALLAPPYVHEGHEVGRIAKLEPGTFENGAIYQHAVAFHVFALLALGRAQEAVDTMLKILPTNPENFDCRRTSEPYCTGNYYCGPGHTRFGQNFFSWFTGNAAWFLRLGFDHLLGVRADFSGLEIAPCVPSHWHRFDVTRTYRGCTYHLTFTRASAGAPCGITVDGQPLPGRIIPPQTQSHCEVFVTF